MPAIVIRLIEWIGSILATSLISRLKSYIEGKIKERDEAKARKDEIEKDIEKLKQAKTEKEFDDASRDVLDNF